MATESTASAAPASGSGAPAPLPARIREAIRVHQESSEILIGWAQLAIVLTFAVLYLLAPMPHAEEVQVSPEPWFLGAYLAFTAARLVLAHCRLLPAWLLHVSVVVDMALLLALIWCIHAKYEQPASFYLKVPTLLYVFIFISLRALRFEARYVLIAGVAAAAGWLLMVAYVVLVDSAEPIITKDYVRYMTSNSVLLGAEFDKVISIIMVTLILALALHRARDLLVRAVTEHSTALELARFVPDRVAEQARSAETPMQAGQGEVGEATILFTDIEGFTTLSERLPPEQLIEVLNAYFSAVSEPIVRHGGVINQFQGDAILATFNMPEALAQHAREAVHAALDIQRTLRRHRFGNGIELRSRVGINTGKVVGGLVGTGDRLGFTVHGDEVNLAARLEQLNKAHGTRILVSRRTADLAGREHFDFVSVGTTAVRGRQAKVEVYTLAGGDGPDPQAGNRDPKGRRRLPAGR